MIFGNNNKKNRLLRILNGIECSLGKEKFAWWPITAVDGKTIWLQKYYETNPSYTELNEDGSYTFNRTMDDKYAWYSRHETEFVIFRKTWHGDTVWRYHRVEEIRGQEALEHLLVFKEQILAEIKEC